MMHFCPNDTSMDVIWFNHGISQCFMDTVAMGTIGTFMLLCGTWQLIMYRRYATEVDPVEIRKSRLYNFQVFLHILLPLLTVARFVLEGFVLEPAQVYGFMILSISVALFAYPFSIVLLVQERHYQLPTSRTAGHGVVLLLFWTMLFITQNIAFVNLNYGDGWFRLETLRDRVEFGLFVVRYLVTMLLFVIGLKAPAITSTMRSEEYQNLQTRPNENQSTFRNAWSKMRTLLPFLWPKKDVILQFRVIFCFVLLIAGRVINLYVPIYNKKIVDSLSVQPPLFRWDWILLYVGFKFLQGGGTGSMGLLNNLRSFLWIRIQQYTTREIEVELFRHLHSLSLRWHLNRKTGEVLRVMDRGTDSINNLLNYILFSIAPTIVDILIAVVFFITAFNWWFGFIVFLTMTLYIVATIMVTEWRTKFQRRMNLADNQQKARSVDSLLNFETVKYYGAEQYEVDSYRESILKFQEEEWRSIITLNILNTMQNIIVCGGLLAGSLLCAYLVVYHDGLTVGDYVLFASYIIQLYVPLNWFGTFYRAIQKNFVDMENMFDLMREEQEVLDAPGAGDLAVVRGGIDFNDVTFGYNAERFVLRNVSFTVPAGKTVAIVGPSGAGKSTIMRLLFRFYDVDSGSISVDGQNIKTVRQASLRKAIGVVPQDTVLFNNTIMYNIQYGRVGAPEADVIMAARSADIHERILNFPDKYETQVGERGLRLSGGEKQRVAIARTILKAPSIVLLDEATSALDTQTERNIQSALAKVCANRTTLIIAHRLSTIIHADEIVVLKEGSIVERGRHEILLERNGVYAEMWSQQLKNLELGSNATEASNEVPNGTVNGTPNKMSAIAAPPAAASHPHHKHQ
ncbi:ATP-binding cassette sub-family B member 6, mitochondrial-like [Anopheles albimanus]|uniref:ATP-binding cassette sub-family B member 6 n=1 Tax=Anopheles albimanus TaxID=7167 RepID=A0A182FBM7_ANOAL|nr:ATP-binding cassette sub-family B member 6, mitochondrial-like [Anopheles albimanus]XP_035774062.1 ATP-binding cassette sub-family B member 6, mitochondrial-like [Anopheles albimanus]